MPDLRETLAVRFFDVVYKARHTPPPPEMLYEAAQLTEYSRMADECIRQMRWVAFQTAHDYRSSEGYEDKDDALADSASFVTAAPEGWNVPGKSSD